MGSAADSNSDQQAAGTNLTKEDVEVIKATQEKLAVLAAETANAKENDEKGLRRLKAIESAAAGMKNVRKKVCDERWAEIDVALMDALKAANTCAGDECARAWETVDELFEAYPVDELFETWSSKQG